MFEGTERSHTGGEERSLTTEVHEKVEHVSMPIQETFQGGQERQGGRTTEYREDKGREGGVLQAIGETVVEIAQQTKDLVIGEGETEEKILGYRSSQVEEGSQQREAGYGQGNGTHKSTENE